jgi:hypothetical protein
MSPIVEHLDVLEDVLGRFVPGRVVPRGQELALSVPKNLSTQALSQPLPRCDMLTAIPWAVSKYWYLVAAY